MKKNDLIGGALDAYGNYPMAAYRYLRDTGQIGVEPLVYGRNPTAEQKNARMMRGMDGHQASRRIPFTRQSDHERACRKQCFAMSAYRKGKGGQKAPDQVPPPSEPDNVPEPPEPKAADEPHALLRKIRELRGFCAARAADGHAIDEIGMRPAEYGARMLSAGIPVRAILHAMTMHWPAEQRRACGIVGYDVSTFRPAERVDGMHKSLPYIMAVIGKRIPCALIGPKGTGKTTLARQIAKRVGVPFGMVSMTSGTSPSAFNGRPKIGGDGSVVQSTFERIYENGGVFLFDEMDAGDENLILLVNAALANGSFFNTQTGMEVKRHPDFIPLAGMNTLGLGAGRDYTARNKLDAATLDRWSMGRVEVTLDEDLEARVFAQNLSA